ncbi:hypothetical protein Tco_0821542 [Tanacetum coccineum]|uniref:Uncharacterized protein n=1 Tax=Tanacetum coccineum TaxID=301880 RepID=A0ABQ5AGN4_9ASTR
MKRKTKAYNSKKLRNNRSEEEEQPESESEEDVKKIKKVKREVAEKQQKPKPFKYKTCLTRSSPKALHDATSDLSEERKKCLKEIRFERYINFPIVKNPSTLAYHVIDKFHTSSMELRLEKGSIKVTIQKIHEILVIPMGETKLEDLNERPSNDPFIKEWKAQYSHVGKPTPPAIASRINSTKETEFMFKMNFITLFGSTIGTLENGGKVLIKLLKYIKEDDE